MKELEVFCNASQARGLKDPLIFIIEYLPIESEHRHPQLKGRRAYQFWMKRNDLPVPFTFGSTLGEEPKVELFKVAKQIIKRLEENRLDIPDLPKPITRYLGKRVLLGQVTDDLVGAHNELRDYLEGLGVTVLPQATYPEWGPEFREFFEGQLAPSDLFIQLLGPVRSEKRQNEEESCAQFQNKAAHDAGKHIIVWRPASLDMTKVKRGVGAHYDMALLETAAAMSS